MKNRDTGEALVPCVYYCPRCDSNHDRDGYRREAGHYSLARLDPGKGMEVVRKVFANGPDTMNWLVLATSGIHGSYASLDDMFDTDEPADIEQNPEMFDSTGKQVYDYMTVQIIQPRLVRVMYGQILITRDDIPWLRDIARRSLLAIIESQAGNL